MSPKAFIKPLPENQQYEPILEGAPQTHGMRAGRVYLQPGEDCGQHSTKGHEELLTFLQGSGHVELGSGEKLKVAVGQVAYVPPHTEHNVINSGTEPLSYIYCVAPTGGA